MNVRGLRCRLGWSQSELAHRLGIQTEVVRAWETGQENPTLQQNQVLEILFRQTEASVLEIQDTPVADSLMEDLKLTSINLRDLMRERSGKNGR